MLRLVSIFTYCFVLVTLRAASPLLTLENEQLPSPAGVGAHSPRLVVSDNNSLSLAWREAGPDQKPTTRSARFDSNTHIWAKPKPDVASISTTPKNDEPIIISKFGRMAKAWFVPDEKDPRILVSTSPNAGEQFLMPVRVEDTRPTGAPDLVLLADGTVFVAWPEHYSHDETALWLRRISPGGSLSVPVLLATMPTSQPTPHLVLIKDFDDKPAQLLLVYTLGVGESSQIVTRLLTIAPPAAAANPCHVCPDADEATRGYALRGRVVSLSAAQCTLTVSHGSIPDVLPDGTTEFKIDPVILKQVATGNEVFARIEKRDGSWWLFAARLIVRPETPSTHRP
jgi:hypothetical protein